MDAPQQPTLSVTDFTPEDLSGHAAGLIVAGRPQETENTLVSIIATGTSKCLSSPACG